MQSHFILSFSLGLWKRASWLNNLLSRPFPLVGHLNGVALVSQVFVFDMDINGSLAMFSVLRLPGI